MSFSEVANPWVFARHLFQPPGADPRETFQLLSDWRSRLGVFCVLWLSIPSVGIRFIGWDLLENAALSLAAGAFFAAAAAAVFWAAAAKPMAWRTEAYTKDAIRRALLSIAATIAMGIIARTGIVAFPILGWLLGLWLIVFALTMMWYCIRWVFGVDEANPLLGPIVTAMTTVSAFAVAKIVNPMDPRPHQVQQLIDYGGLATVLIIAVIEAIVVLSTGRHIPEHPPAPHGRHQPYPPAPYVDLTAAALQSAVSAAAVPTAAAAVQCSGHRSDRERAAVLARLDRAGDRRAAADQPDRRAWPRAGSGRDRPQRRHGACDLPARRLHELTPSGEAPGRYGSSTNVQ
jgi:hypothetical protein